MIDDASRRRLAEGYEPRFDIDLPYGQTGELFVRDIGEALRNGMAEVKRDGKWQRTKNLYLEYECLYASGWRPTGIDATTSLYWAFVLGDLEVALVLPTATLRDAYHYYKERQMLGEEKDGSHPTRGVLIPIHGLIEWLALRQRGVGSCG